MTAESDSHPPSKRHTRIIAGFGAQGVSVGLTILTQLLSVPVLLAQWGTGAYAEWLVMAAVAGFIPLTDIGASAHLGNSLRAAWARGDREAGRRILRSGLGFYLGQGIVVLVLLVCLVPAFDLTALMEVGRIGLPQETLILLCLNTLVLVSRGFLANLHSAHGRFAREVLGIAGVQTTLVLSVLVTALVGGTPFQAALAQFVTALIVGWGGLVAELRRCYPTVPLTPCLPTLDEIRLIATKGPFYIVGLSGFRILLYLPVIVLGQVSSDQSVIVFSTIRTYTGLVRQAVLQFALSVGLELSAMMARQEAAAARSLYVDTAVPFAAAIGILCGGAWAASEGVFRIWTGGAVPVDHGTAILLLAGTFLLAPLATPVSMLRFMDRAVLMAAAQALEIVAAVLLMVGLIPAIGPMGAAIGLVVAECAVSAPWLLRSAGREFGGIPRDLLPRAYGAGLAGLALALSVAAGVGTLLPHDSVIGLLALVLAMPIPAGLFMLAMLTPGQRRRLLWWRRCD